jgi:hypothetical protein
MAQPIDVEKRWPEESLAGNPPSQREKAEVWRVGRREGEREGEGVEGGGARGHTQLM